MDDIFTGVGTLHKSQDEFINGGADIFSTAPTDKATMYSNDSVYTATSENPLGPYSFIIPAEGDTYIDPQSFRLSGYAQIKKLGANGQLSDLVTTQVKQSDNSMVDVHDKVAPINFLPGMAFQTKELTINTLNVTYATQPLENYKAYVENLLSYGSEIKNTILAATAGWLPDVNVMESDGTKQQNVGAGVGSKQWLKRQEMYKKSKRVGFSIPLQLDVLTTDRFLPKGITLTIKLTKAPDTLLYVTSEAAQYKVLLHDLKLHVNRIKMTDALVLDHERRFKSGQLASFPYIRTDVIYKSIPQGTSIYRTQNMYRNVIPNSCIIFFVQQAALAGASNLDPLNFEHFNIRKLACLRNSQEIPPNGYSQDYENDDYVETYRRVMDEIGIRTNNIGNDITYEMFKNGFNFYAFDFSPDKCNGFHDHLTMGGAIDFSVVFGGATKKDIAMVILSHYDDKLELDAARNVTNKGEPTAITLN